MSDRLEQMITRFAAAHPQLADPAEAWGSCQAASNLFAETAAAAGVQGETVTFDAFAAGYPMSSPTGWGAHTAHTVWGQPQPDGSWLTVDFTAAQYGLSAFPLTGRLIPDGDGRLRHSEMYELAALTGNVT